MSRRMRSGLKESIINRYDSRQLGRTLCDTVHAIVLSGVELSDAVPVDGSAKVWDLVGDVHDLSRSQWLPESITASSSLRCGLPSMPEGAAQDMCG